VSKISRPPLQSKFFPPDRYGSVGQAGSFNPVGPFVLPDLQGRTRLPLRSVVWQYPRSLNLQYCFWGETGDLLESPPPNQGFGPIPSRFMYDSGEGPSHHVCRHDRGRGKLPGREQSGEACTSGW